MNFANIPCPAGGYHDYDALASDKRCSKCNTVLIIPQPVQVRFLKSAASIVIFGGAKGCSKSFSLLLETTRHLANPQFGAVVFRRESTQIFGEGGLWDTAEKIYPHHGGQPYRYRSEWIFPSGAKVKFAHLSMEKDVNAWDGQQVPLIGFDELTLFTEKQFWYMLTINRSTCGVQPYIRCTCNPDADSWVANLMAWWIDQDTGFPIPDRAGKLRWFVREGGQLVWADSRAELLRKFPKQMPKSLTFIPAKLEDNPILERADPGYRANLMAQETVIRQRLLDGNWKVRPQEGFKFPRNKWDTKYEAPPSGLRLVRFWDKASTPTGKGARSAGVLMGFLADHLDRGMPPYWIVHVAADRWDDSTREARIRSLAETDNQTYGHVTIGIEKEGGSGGSHSAIMTITGLAGYDVYAERPLGSKADRWTALARQQQVGNVAIVRGSWDWSGFIDELDALSGDEVKDRSKLKDCADASAGAFKFLTGSGGIVQGELLASGDPEFLAEESKPFDKEEIDSLPEDWRELIEESNAAAAERRGRWDD